MQPLGGETIQPLRDGVEPHDIEEVSIRHGGYLSSGKNSCKDDAIGYADGVAGTGNDAPMEQEVGAQSSEAWLELQEEADSVGARKRLFAGAPGRCGLGGSSHQAPGLWRHQGDDEMKGDGKGDDKMGYDDEKGKGKDAQVVS